MQRFVNNPDFIVDDMLKGLVKANPEVRFSEENDHVISMKEMKKGKVGVITGGGSGHEPAFVGYLGDGMLDSVAIGEVFASPPALHVLILRIFVSLKSSLHAFDILGSVQMP